MMVKAKYKTAKEHRLKKLETSSRGTKNQNVKVQLSVDKLMNDRKGTSIN